MPVQKLWMAGAIPVDVPTAEINFPVSSQQINRVTAVDALSVRASLDRMSQAVTIRLLPDISTQRFSSAITRSPLSGIDRRAAVRDRSFFGRG
jgi:hypothetical protein